MKTSFSSLRTLASLLSVNFLLASTVAMMPPSAQAAPRAGVTAKAGGNCNAILSQIQSAMKALKKAKKSKSPGKANVIKKLSKKLRGLKQQLALCQAMTAPLPGFVEIELVPVGDPGNPDDPSDGDDISVGVQNYGGVPHEFQIGKFEVSVEQYASFLNAVAKTDTYGLYNANMASDAQISGIQRTGDPGSYRYTVIGSGKKPVSYVSWLDAARFCNWLHNLRPDGAQDDTTTETGAYDLDGANVELMYTRQPGATFWIPTADEWYKAAYYQPSGMGGPVDHYWLYPTRSDTAPGNLIGATANQANYYYADVYSVTQNASFAIGQNYLTDGGSYTGSASYYGTFDQGGNLREWNEDETLGTNRLYRGGAFDDTTGKVSSGGLSSLLPEAERYDTGFRVATTAAVP